MSARIFLLVGMILLTAPFALSAEDESATYDRACKAYNDGAYFTAFQDLQPFAARGDAQAQFAIAEMLRSGQGTRRNREEAVIWYRRAAEQDHGAAQCNLGMSLFNGWGVRADPQAAIDWWLRAAVNDNAHAMFNLGTVTARGRYVKRDFVRAYWWMLRASESGYAGADKVLATLRKVMTPTQIKLVARMTTDDAMSLIRLRPGNSHPDKEKRK